MANAILITGASSGIGKATAGLFHERGWNVVATMREPEREADLRGLDNVLVTRLDVTDTRSIQAAVAAAIDRFERIDVLLNNAGYGAYGPLEATPSETIRRQFDTNVIGLLEVTKALLPHFRANRAGTIVNISSIGGRMAFPLGSLYHGTKWAVEGLSEALTFELDAIGARMKIVEPGLIATDFGGRSLELSSDESMDEYEGMLDALFAGMSPDAGRYYPPTVVAEVIYQAATDGTDRLRYAGDEAARAMIAQREATDSETFLSGIKAQFGLVPADSAT
jgi:NAD(P)-dependent dehydrogenase (short-subunit alcohol dehydrogenase family)